jgi:predicted Rossmann fold nucleotide-binding protein DprA/Smf involved in DNA uptake
MSGRLVAVVGSRALPASWAGRASQVVKDLARRGRLVGSGGALGADLFALQAVLQLGAVEGSQVFLPGSVSQAPAASARLLHAFVSQGGEVVSGPAVPGCSRHDYVAALFNRSQALVRASVGVVAFVVGQSPGTWFTCQCAARLGRSVVVFPVEGPRALRSLGCGSWQPLSIWSGAWRWVPSVQVGQRCRHGITVQCCAGV